MVRTVRYLTGEGWPEAFSRVWRAFTDWFCSRRRQVILEWRPTEGGEHAVAAGGRLSEGIAARGRLLQLIELTPADRPELERAMYHSPREIEHRFQQGDRCFG